MKWLELNVMVSIGIKFMFMYPCILDTVVSKNVIPTKSLSYHVTVSLHKTSDLTRYVVH